MATDTGKYAGEGHVPAQGMWRGSAHVMCFLGLSIGSTFHFHIFSTIKFTQACLNFKPVYVQCKIVCKRGRVR